MTKKDSPVIPKLETSSSSHLEISSVAALFSDELATSRGIAHDRFPQTTDEADQLEEALANELAEKLSLAEQERIQLDIHGLQETNNPPPAVVAEKLEELARALDRLRPKAAYDRARLQNPAYVDNEAFRLLFLRTDRFDAQAAAQRLALHFQVKNELFGEELLGRNVTWEDLEPVDRLMVKSGQVQIGPKRDIAGRTIFFRITQFQPLSALALLRSNWYIFMSALLTDTDVQEKGIVLVVFNFDGEMASLSAMRQRQRFRQAIPIITAATHYCYRHAALRPMVMGLPLLTLTKIGEVHQRLPRLKIHFGSMATIAFKLQTFGIPMDSSPVTMSLLRDAASVNLSIAWHLEWVETMREMEHWGEDVLEDPQQDKTKDSSEASIKLDETVIVVPRRFDVLLGKTKDAMTHPGTVRCQHLVQMHLDEYEQAGRREKTDVADRIVAIIRESQGRFLKKSSKYSDKGTVVSSWWVPVDHVAARDKVSYSFRNMRKNRPSVPVADEGASNPEVSKSSRTGLKRSHSAD